MKYTGSFDRISLKEAQSVIPWNEYWQKCPKGAELYVGESFAGTTDLVWFDEENGTLRFIGTIEEGVFYETES